MCSLDLLLCFVVASVSSCARSSCPELLDHATHGLRQKSTCPGSTRNHIIGDSPTSAREDSSIKFPSISEVETLNEEGIAINYFFIYAYTLHHYTILYKIPAPSLPINLKGFAKLALI